MGKTKIGFTGSRRGLSRKQEDKLKMTLSSFNIKEFHHGGCSGADHIAHSLVAYLKSNMGVDCHIHVHPTDLAGHSDDFNIKEEYSWDVYYRHKPPLERNHDIVDATEVLIAISNTQHEVLRSGTWATIRYALKTRKDVVIIYPDGTSEYITAKT